MKFKNFLLAMALIPGMMFFGCQPDNVKPNNGKTDGPAADLNGEHTGPTAPCGPAVWFDIVNTQGENNLPEPLLGPQGWDYGSVEIVTEASSIWVMCHFGEGWYAQTVKLYYGQPNGMPTLAAATSQINWALWPTSYAPTPSSAEVRGKIDRSVNQTTNGMLVMGADIHQLDDFGQPLNFTRVWGTGGDAILNGWGMAYACAPCGGVPPGGGLDLTGGTSCVSIMKGYPATQSATISAGTVTGGTAPYTFTWSNGATGESITVSPSETTSYTVTVTDASGATAVSSVSKTVNVTNIDCTPGNSPNHKVQVCHKPPGNPGNVQNICIAWSGVPAHVEAFRDPNTNYNQGHDSGCSIGPCGYTNPCPAQ